MFAFRKRLVETVRDLDVVARWDSAQNKQWKWMTKICKNNEKKSESRIEDKWGREAVLAGKAEIRNMWQALGIMYSVILHFKKR